MRTVADFSKRQKNCTDRISNFPQENNLLNHSFDIAVVGLTRGPQFIQGISNGLDPLHEVWRKGFREDKEI